MAAGPRQHRTVSRRTGSLGGLDVPLAAVLLLGLVSAVVAWRAGPLRGWAERPGGWLLLTGLATSGGLAFTGLATLRGRGRSRAFGVLRCCLLVSVLVHVGLAGWMHHLYLRSPQFLTERSPVPYDPSAPKTDFSADFEPPPETTADPLESPLATAAPAERLVPWDRRPPAEPGARRESSPSEPQELADRLPRPAELEPLQRPAESPGPAATEPLAERRPPAATVALAPEPERPLPAAAPLPAGEAPALGGGHAASGVAASREPAPEPERPAIVGPVQLARKPAELRPADLLPPGLSPSVLPWVPPPARTDAALPPGEAPAVLPAAGGEPSPSELARQSEPSRPRPELTPAGEPPRRLTVSPSNIPHRPNMPRAAESLASEPSASLARRAAAEAGSPGLAREPPAAQVAYLAPAVSPPALPNLRPVLVPPRLEELPATRSASPVVAIAPPLPDAFRHREPSARRQSLLAYGGSGESERCVARGLEYLARCQFPDGHWSLHRLPDSLRAADDPALGEMQSDTAATGLALLALMGTGNTHREGRFQKAVEQGLRWLVGAQKEDGDLFTGGTSLAWFYSHGIGSIALCEAYGMTADARFRTPARKAVEFIVRTQNPDMGGWRYFPREESDTSVTGWQLMALTSARMAGLQVPEATRRKIGQWLDTAQSSPAGGLYAYNPQAPDTAEQGQGRLPSLAMTAEGLLMRVYLGWPSDHPGLVQGADHLLSHLPSLGEGSVSQRDAYYWYYGTQFMFQMQGRYWQAWNAQLQRVLESTQVRTGRWSGSWDPNRPAPDQWAQQGGRLYVTVLHLLTLEVYYRYLPLFQVRPESP